MSNIFKPTEQDIQYILDNYLHYTSREIANYLGCSASYVKKIGKQVSKGHKPKCLYHCNEDYFDIINTYEKAYWLGFIMADGCVYQRKNNDNAQKWIVLTISGRDIEHLNKFKQAIHSNHPIKEYTQSGFLYAGIRIVSDKMANDLAKYGCIERKTGKVQFPELDNDELKWGFVAGYVDGDGCIAMCHDRNGIRYKWSVVGNIEILSKMQEFLQSYNIKPHLRQDCRDYAFDFYELSCERMEYLNIIFSNTYNKNIVYLNRKYDRVQKYYQEKYKPIK